jgi:uncharacterized protein YbcC (UPF0753/DUF2309 family)
MEQELVPPLKFQETELLNSLKSACKKIAPVWPLENFVAVNPYLGHTRQGFEDTAKELAQIDGIKMTLPQEFYVEKWKRGELKAEEIEKVLLKKDYSEREVELFWEELERSEGTGEIDSVLATLIDIATEHTGKDWRSFAVSSISNWAAAYYDQGQASWNLSDTGEGAFKAWKMEAAIDRSPEIAGLKNFRQAVKDLPEDALTAIKGSLNTLQLEVTEEAYFHRLLVRHGGWAAHTARIDWDRRLNGEKEEEMLEFLAILLCWEACTYKALYSLSLEKRWVKAKQRLQPGNIDSRLSKQLLQNLILQEAFDLSLQRELIKQFNTVYIRKSKKEPEIKAQAIFCIDVRSEVFRRNLENLHRGIETIGFAGFFGFPIQYVPIAHKKGEAQCPVLLKAGPQVMEQLPDKQLQQKVERERMLQHQLKQVWKAFKSGAVSCFSYVSPLGLSFLPKLFTDSFGLTRPVSHPSKTGMNEKQYALRGVHFDQDIEVGISLEEQIKLAGNALRAMSLTENFAEFILVVGHGASTVNNPHSSALDCGACGGHSGESNAKVAAKVLNSIAVRKGLEQEGISIPAKTVFLACLHNTTTDELSIFNEKDIPKNQRKGLQEIKQALVDAGEASRSERALRMNVEEEQNSAIKKRSKDWSQLRPEWGLAGCSSFIIAPRERTKNINLEGKSFLHSYDWKKDANFSVLEAIMTAPMLVTSWINLQYYASTVDSKHYGAGNKALHNVTAGVGVLEGFSGDLRIGLPQQSVHDGEIYQHEPSRLKVVIEAPREAIDNILEKHENLRELFHNEWLYLFIIDEKGKISQQYNSEGCWKSVQ